MANFTPDESVNIIPITIHNATKYVLTFDSYSPGILQYVYFPKSIDSFSVAHAYIFDNLSLKPLCQPTQQRDYWIRYRFNNKINASDTIYSTPFVFHIDVKKKSKVNANEINGIQTGLRVLKFYVQLVKMVVPPEVKAALTVLNILMTGANISLTITKFLDADWFIYFLAYPYPPNDYETPAVEWYPDNLGNISRNANHLYGHNKADSGFVTENYVIMDNNKPNFPAYPDTAKFRGYQAPRIIVNIYPNYLYRLSQVSAYAEYIKGSSQYTENPKMKKLVDKILESDVDGLSGLYSEIGYDKAEKTSALFYECLTNETNVSSPELETQIDEILKFHKIE
jgi:hypothetical protein